MIKKELIEWWNKKSEFLKGALIDQTLWVLEDDKYIKEIGRLIWMREEIGELVWPKYIDEM